MSDANHHDDDSIMGNSIQQDLDYDSSEEMGGKGKSRTDITVNTPTMSEFLVHNMSILRIIMDKLFFLSKLYMFCMNCEVHYKYI